MLFILLFIVLCRFYVIQHVFINMHIAYASICNNLIISSIKPRTGEPMTNRC